jgi:hypothetical protein
LRGLVTGLGVLSLLLQLKQKLDFLNFPPNGFWKFPAKNRGQI